MSRLLLQFFLFFIGTVCFSQSATDPLYKTIEFKTNRPLNDFPIVKLNSPFKFEFDVLNTEEEDFYYEIILCNYDWSQSNLFKAEYLEGFDKERIVNYENSFNTLQPYSHYTLSIPNQSTKALLKTGNYLLNIYNDYDELVIQRKFIVYKPLTTPQITVKRAREIEQIKTHQNIELKINIGNITVNNPQSTVKIALYQNNNFNTVIKNVKPQYVLGTEISYKYTDKIIFEAGNEHLNFENKDLRSNVYGVAYFDMKDIYESHLQTNIKRTNSLYTYYPDINGAYKVNALNTVDLDIEADYSEVFFSLKHEELPFGYNMYVYGGFNNYELNDENKLIFDSKNTTYSTNMKLKQGFYNYKYIVTNDYNELEHGYISGNFWQTENNYKVIVYYREIGGRHDRVIGFNEINSTNIRN